MAKDTTMKDAVREHFAKVHPRVAEREQQAVTAKDVGEVPPEILAEASKTPPEGFHPSEAPKCPSGTEASREPILGAKDFLPGVPQGAEPCVWEDAKARPVRGDVDACPPVPGDVESCDKAARAFGSMSYPRRRRQGIMCIPNGKTMIVEADEGFDLEAAIKKFREDFGKPEQTMKSAVFPAGVRITVI